MRIFIPFRHIYQQHDNRWNKIRKIKRVFMRLVLYNNIKSSTFAQIWTTESDQKIQSKKDICKSTNLSTLF
jgi:hypothetical protein